ncbi:glutathione S-transferase [Myxococcus fulvus]|uniref:Glutathione S-transferase n=1 Tax=Myxococcus fulvus TaxID=33 RepID=A0A511TCB7_MYXFU|nr:glutathione binding-like protein [Myxococcus fulvus]GEN11824.1 glutathione S-transferase [Myxococcus fulvus]SEU40616.1 glutathione S-transferase [Myxococcus fulvus]
MSGFNELVSGIEGAPVTLYASPLACSAAVHIIMLELGTPHAVEFVDIYTQPHVLLSSGAVYKDLNPKDAVPALRLGSGELHTEVGVILQLLGDLSPESCLVPRPGTLARYRVMEWLSYVGSELHKTIGPLFNPAMPEAAKVLHRQKLRRTMSYMEQCLAATPYLTGDAFTAADAYLFVMLGWPLYFKVDLRPYPNLTRYHQHISERPSFLRMKKLIAPALDRMKLPAFPVFGDET